MSRDQREGLAELARQYAVARVGHIEAGGENDPNAHEAAERIRSIARSLEAQP